MTTPIKLPDISEQEQSPLVLELLAVIREQTEAIQHLKEEIARLKKQQSEEVQQLKNEIAHLKQQTLYRFR